MTEMATTSIAEDPWAQVASGLPTFDDAVCEVVIIGTGFGESVLVHLGGGEWMIVDSCTRDGEVLPLRYLRERGQSPGAVSRVIASHWDKDHVEGLAVLFDSCVNAALVVPAPLSAKGLLAHLVDAARATLPYPGTLQAGIHEYANALEIVRGRPDTPDGSSPWKPADAITLLRRNAEATGGEVLVEAWSPHPRVTLHCVDEVAEFLVRSLSSPLDASEMPKGPRGNHLSIATSVRTGDRRLLLGADVERPAWRRIGRNRNRDPGEAEFLKVPHHGSRHATRSAVWELCIDGPLAGLTPWNLAGRSVPRQRDLAALLPNVGTLFSSHGEDCLTCIAQLKMPPVGILVFRCPLVGESEWVVDCLGSSECIERSGETQ